MGIIHDRIKSLRVGADMTQEELAAKLDISKGAIGNYETGRRVPDMDTLNAIADIFNVDMDYLMGRTNERPEYTLEEQWLIGCYRKTDDDVKTAVKTILRKFGDAPQKVEVEKPKKIIPLFGSAFAAGSFEPGTQAEPFVDYEVDADSKAEFAVKISGDSMDPELHDGEIALCRKRNPTDGEIIVCLVNGSFYVKQFITDGMNIYLRSINRARKDADLDIWHYNNDTFQCFGTVIHKKIPLVME